jgi:predicted Zn-dependent protease
MIEQLVERLVAASDRPDLHYRVTMLNSETVNAFALPTGQLYVTRGLIALANDQSELASVIGHEMGHVIAHHAEAREQEIRDEELSDKVFTNLISDPRAGALALARSKLKLATFSQQQELAADAIGIGIAAHAGYDPYGAARFLASLQRSAELKPRPNGVLDPAAPDFLSSHPSTPDRISRALATARQYKAPADETAQQRQQARDAYLADIDGMVFGEDPSEGFVRGRRFLHPRLGFTFIAPEGFLLDNTAQAVLGVKRDGGSALRLDVVHVPAEQSLTAYVNSGWIENIDATSVHELTINGFPAAAATAKGDDWDFRLYVIRFGSDVYRFIFACKNFTPAIDRQFRQSVDTFRRMTLTEIQRAHPLHLKVVQVGSQDTVEKLAARMAVPDRQVERFRVLNGLDSSQRLQPGSEVKIVVE